MRTARTRMEPTRDASSSPSQAPQPRQFVNFAFYRVDPAWRRLPKEEREKGVTEWLSVYHEFRERCLIYPYTLFGIRAEVDFMLWRISTRLEDFVEMSSALARTGLGAYLTTSYSYLAMTKRSIYVEEHDHEGQEGTRLRVHVVGSKYLVVYPFLKTRDWYHLTKHARQGMMNEHIEVGHKYPSVRLNTTYSFGLDDQEFVLAFETDRLEDFVDLVEELRYTEVSRYTLRDVPIFTCVSGEIDAVIGSLGG